MFRVITANLNGIRSAARKGFFDWFGEQKADVVCVQEIKCSQDDLTPEFLAPHGFQGYFQHAVKKGYSGAGIYTRHEPDEVVIGLRQRRVRPRRALCGSALREAFRGVGVRAVGFERRRTPAGQVPLHGRFMPHLAELPKERELILCGDVNIVHKEIDIKNWKSNQKNSGLPAGRARMADEAVRRRRLTSMCSARSTSGPSSTRGGAIAGRPTRRTSGGGSTTRSRRAESRRLAKRTSLSRGEVQRPRAADGRLRLESEKVS